MTITQTDVQQGCAYTLFGAAFGSISVGLLTAVSVPVSITGGVLCGALSGTAWAVNKIIREGSSGGAVARDKGLAIIERGVDEVVDGVANNVDKLGQHALNELSSCANVLKTTGSIAASMYCSSWAEDRARQHCFSPLDDYSCTMYTVVSGIVFFSGVGQSLYLAKEQRDLCKQTKNQSDELQRLENDAKIVAILEKNLVVRELVKRGKDCRSKRIAHTLDDMEEEKRYMEEEERYRGEYLRNIG